jgi:uncharacterized protein
MKININELEVVDNEENGRFEVQLGDQVAFAAYQLGGDVITFTHTIVPKEYEGQGVGAKLVMSALENVGDRGLKVVPVCPFVSAYIRSHPQYKPLLLGYDAQE